MLDAARKGMGCISELTVTDKSVCPAIGWFGRKCLWKGVLGHKKSVYDGGTGRNGAAGLTASICFVGLVVTVCILVCDAFLVS